MEFFISYYFTIVLSLTERELLSWPAILISSVQQNHGLVFEQTENLLDHMLL